MNIRDVAKELFGSLGLRIVNARRRWGVDPIDDLRKIVGDLGELRLVYDVGGNIGQTAILFERHFPRATIRTFEPVSNTFNRLIDNVKGKNRIHPQHLALGSELGRLKISLFGDSGTSSLAGQMSDSLHSVVTGEEIVEVSTVDTIVNTFDDVSIDLLKIDTEGFDINVLRGASESLRQHRIKFVFFEFHTIESERAVDGVAQLGSFYECDRLLRQAGYRFVSMYTDSVHADEPIGTYNALYMANTVPYKWSP